MRAVLDRSPSVGVRGEFTAKYLRGLGFRDVEVIGCPSMFFHGDRLTVERRVPTLTPASPLAINVSPYVSAMGPIVMRHVERYPDLRYIAQDLGTLDLLLHGDRRPTPVPPANPTSVTHPLFQQGKVRLYLDPWPWFAALREVDFSFGTRIHGNIAALVAGTPAVVLARDSRTLELARYFEIPHRRMDEVGPEVDAATLYEEADFGPLLRGHADRFRVFTEYLARHRLHHVFEPGEDPTSSTGGWTRRGSRRQWSTRDPARAPGWHARAGGWCDEAGTWRGASRGGLEAGSGSDRPGALPLGNGVDQGRPAIRSGGPALDRERLARHAR